MSEHHGNTAKSQLDKFKEAARDLDCDDDEKRFAHRLGKLVRPDSEESKNSDTPPK